MAQYQFELARESDDEALRDVLRQTAMQGSINLGFEREPNYFWAERLGSVRTDVGIARNISTGKVVGCASRAIRKAYVDGHLESIGYLGGLRIVPEVRGSAVLARGYRFLRSMHRDGEVPFYLTSILNENQLAKNVLTSARAGLPIYVPLGTFITGLIPLVRQRPRQSQVKLLRQSTHEVQAVVAAINSYNRSWQYAPHINENDFYDGVRLRGFSLDDMYVYSKGGQILGTIGVWDQHSFKQTVVRSYSESLACLRPLYNVYAKLRSIPPLPPPGSFIRNVYGAFLSVKDDDPAIFHSLINAIQDDWSGKGFSYLAVGLHQDHPLAPALISRSARTLESTLYIVYWGEPPELRKVSRIPQVEIATL